MALTQQQYTLADLLVMTADDQLYEILEGELVVFTAPDDQHMRAVLRLVGLMLDAEDAGFGRVGAAPRAVALDFALRGMQAQDVPQPDVFFVRRERLDILATRAVQEPPDLVVEVLSPTTRHRDLPGGQKWKMYQRAGVPHYWLVDTDAHTVTQYVLVAGRYGEPVTLHPGDILTSPLFPGITRDVASLFAPADGV